MPNQNKLSVPRDHVIAKLAEYKRFDPKQYGSVKALVDHISKTSDNPITEEEINNYMEEEYGTTNSIQTLRG